MNRPTAPSSPSALVTELTERAAAWSQVSLAPESTRAVAFRVNDTTFGVLHHDGLVEVPVPVPIQTVLVEEGYASRQAARPGAEWVALYLQETDDLDPAALLLRLSYLYRRLLRSQNLAALRRIRIEVTQYSLPPALESVYEAMLAKREADLSPDGPAPAPTN